MNQITVTGMVLSATPVGDYDRRVVLLTKERGKIAAFARGARRTNSSLLGVTSPFSFGEFVVYEGRTSYTLMSASISNYFSELRTDVEGAYYGFYFLDFAGYYAREANDETELLKLLYQTLRALTNVHIPNRLIRCIYELKAVCIKFSVRKGGLVCRKCEIHAPDAVMVGTSTLYTLQYIISSKVEKLYTFAVKEEVLLELENLIRNYLNVYVGRNFKSLEILETIV